MHPILDEAARAATALAPEQILAIMKGAHKTDSPVIIQGCRSDSRAGLC